jgi:hypothetical protein
MATIITVFAGFLVAILTILGDPSMIPEGSWRVAEISHKNLVNSVIRHTWLFYIYILTIAFILLGVFIRKEPDSVASERIKAWVECIYLFLVFFSFLLTLALPRALGKIQLARSEAVIEARRAAAKIPHGPESKP